MKNWHILNQCFEESAEEVSDPKMKTRLAGIFEKPKHRQRDYIVYDIILFSMFGCFKFLKTPPLPKKNEDKISTYRTC